MQQLNLENSDVLKVALKYSVISKETSFVGVIKQKDKSTAGELVKFSINTIKKEEPKELYKSYVPPSYGGGFGGGSLAMKSAAPRS